MLHFFFEGGWEFMSIISLLAIAMLFFSFKSGSRLFSSHVPLKAVPMASLYYVRFFGMLALVAGLLGQIIGLYEAMKHIAAQGGISQEVLAGGIRVSSITTLYGLLIFLLGHLIWFGLDFTFRKKTKSL